MEFVVESVIVIITLFSHFGFFPFTKYKYDLKKKGKNMTQEVFNRTEKKYIINKTVGEKLLLDLQKYVMPEEYGEYTIRNIYFDTENDSYIRKSIEKPVYKDSNIRCRDVNLSLADDTQCETILPTNQWVMEVKIKGAMPLWMSGLLSKYKIYPTSFSKYGTYYKKRLQRNGEKIC